MAAILRVLLLLILPTVVYAQTWTGLGSTGDWSDAGNWDPAVPANDGTASIVFGAGENAISIVDSPWSVLGFLFNNTSGQYSIGGSPLTVGSGGLTNQDADTQTFTDTLSLSSNQTWSAGSGGFRFLGSVSQGSFGLTLAGPYDFLFSGTRSGTGSFALTSNADVLLTNSSSSNGSVIVSESNSGGRLSFSSASQIGTGAIAINQNGRLRLLDTGGSTVTLGNLFTWNGNRFSLPASPVIEVVGANDTLELTRLIAMTNREGIIKDGRGTLRYVPSTLATDSRWSLGIRSGTVELNQLPYRSGLNNNQGQPTGDFSFDGNSTLRVLYNATIAGSLPGPATNFYLYGYGFSQIRVSDGVTGKIQVEPGAVFKITGRTDTNNAMIGNNATLVLEGSDLTSLFQFGYGTAGGTINNNFVNRTIDLRGGTLSFFGSGANKPFWPQSLDFTMKLNGGEYDGRSHPTLQSLPGNLVINDNPSASDPRVRAWIVNNTGGGNSSFGNTQWNGRLIKVGDAGDVLSFDRTASGNGTSGFVSLGANASLDIQGGIVRVAGGQDIFTDSFDSTRHVNVTVGNGTTLQANRQIGIGRLQGNGTMTTSTSGLKTVTLETGENSSFGGTITNGSGQLAILKRGSGGQTFTQAQTYTGSTTVEGGSLTLSGNGSLLGTSALNIFLGDLILDNTTINSGNRLSDTASILLGSGTGAGSLRFLGNSLATSTETVGVVTAAGGASSVILAPGAGQNATLTLSGLNRSGEGTIQFSAVPGTLGGGSATDPSVFISGLSNGLIGGWATVGNRFAEYDSLAGVRAFATSDTNFDSSTSSVRDIDITASQVLTGNDNENSVRYTGAFDTDFAGFTVNIFGGGLLKADATTSSLSNGTLTAGNSTAGALDINVVTGGRFEISASIADNGGGMVSVVKSGLGDLELQGTNSFGGGLTVNEGTVNFSADNQLGALGGNITLAGGNLRKSTAVGDVTFDAGRTLTIQQGRSAAIGVEGGKLSVGAAGQLVSGGGSTLIKTGNGTLSLQAANPGFQSTTRVQSGALELLNVQSLGTSQSAIFLEGGTLATTLDGNATFAKPITVSSNSTLDVRRATGGGGTGAIHSFASLAFLNSTLTVQTDSSQYIASVPFLSLSGNGATTINTAANATLSVTQSVTGSGGFSKTGSGTLVLSGNQANTYTGAVSVNAGLLRLEKQAGSTAITGNLSLGNATVLFGNSGQISNQSAVSISEGLFDINGTTQSVGSLSGNGSVALGGGNLTVGALGSNTTFSGDISETGIFEKSGLGTLSLSGSNTFAGTFLVNAGTMKTLGSDRFNTNVLLSVASGAAAELGGSTESFAGLSGGGLLRLGTSDLTLNVGAGSQTFSGAISGSGELNKTGAGTQILSGQNTFTGNMSVSGGTLAAGRGEAFDSNVSLTLDNATFSTGGFSQNLQAMNLTSNATFDFANLSSVMAFAIAAPNFGDLNGNTMTVVNWTGTIGVAGGVDQLIFASGLSPLIGTTTNLIRFQIGATFYDGLVLSRSDLGINYVEIVPVPEPSIPGLVVTAALIAFLKKRRPRRTE